MPAFEMPLEELRSYGGRNPRPADFDAYWDRALRELDATNPQPELVPHSSPARFAECFDLWFKGAGLGHEELPGSDDRAFDFLSAL